MYLPRAFVYLVYLLLSTAPGTTAAGVPIEIDNTTLLGYFQHVSSIFTGLMENLRKYDAIDALKEVDSAVLYFNEKLGYNSDTPVNINMKDPEVNEDFLCNALDDVLFFGTRVVKYVIGPDGKAITENQSIRGYQIIFCLQVNVYTFLRDVVGYQSEDNTQSIPDQGKKKIPTLTGCSSEIQEHAKFFYTRVQAAKKSLTIGGSVPTNTITAIKTVGSSFRYMNKNLGYNPKAWVDFDQTSIEANEDVLFNDLDQVLISGTEFMSKVKDLNPVIMMQKQRSDITSFLQYFEPDSELFLFGALGDDLEDGVDINISDPLEDGEGEDGPDEDTEDDGKVSLDNGTKRSPTLTGCGNTVKDHATAFYDSIGDTKRFFTKDPVPREAGSR